MTDFGPSGRCFVLPSLLRTPTGTITVGGDGKLPANCCKGGIVEQYSIGLFGFGCLPYNDLLNTPFPDNRSVIQVYGSKISNL